MPVTTDKEVTEIKNKLIQYAKEWTLITHETRNNLMEAGMLLNELLTSRGSINYLKEQIEKKDKTIQNMKSCMDRLRERLEEFK